MRSGLLISCDHYAKNSTLHRAVSFLKFSFIGLFLASLSLQWLCAGFLQLWGVGPLLSGVHGLLIAVASHCAAQALGLRAPIVVLVGLDARWRVACSHSRDPTHVPCISRWMHILCTTREVPL